MILQILEEVKETGLCIQEVASKYQLPATFVMDTNGLIEFEGQKTPAEFKERHPYRKYVTIGTKETISK
jgi:hypothetical protein